MHHSIIRTTAAVLAVALLALTPPIADADPGSPAPVAAASCDDSPNVIWPTARRIEAGTDAVQGRIATAGQERWYRFAVQPGSRVTVTLRDATIDDDLALFTDLGTALHQLAPNGRGPDATDITEISAETSSPLFDPSSINPGLFAGSGSSGGSSTLPGFDDQLTGSSAFAPSVFSPSVFSPSVFSPSVFSPSVFSADGAFDPGADLAWMFKEGTLDPSITPEWLAQAFSIAETRSVVAVSAQPGTADERVVGDTWTSTGSFYVRVSGRNGAASCDPFTVEVSTRSSGCSTPDPHADLPLWHPSAWRWHPSTVVVTDLRRLKPNAALRRSLDRFARFADAALVDLDRSPRVRKLNAQASRPDQISCPLAKNLVAEAAREIVNRYYRPGGKLRYVVIAGDDGVVPFFRYPDKSGLGPEQDYQPPVRGVTASDASLRGNYVLGQDAYGAVSDLQLRGVAFPLADLGVGRLVKTPDEIAATLDRYRTRRGAPLRPRSSLVTGYDFLTDAADQVAHAFRKIGAGPHDELITDDRAPAADQHDRRHRWTAAELQQALLQRRHDLIFLAGHFSANNTLAADGTTTLADRVIDAAPARTLRDSVIFSIGCHSGYSIVDRDGIDGVTDSLDWTQVFARKGAALIAGTGFQYGDTDFVRYSEQLYAGLAREFQGGPGPVPLGQALVRAKQAYLRDATELNGVDQKSVLQATLYGLPMLRVAVPHRRSTPPRRPDSAVVPVTAGPGRALGLSTGAVSATGAPAQRSVTLQRADGQSVTATYRVGEDGVTSSPAAPVLPLEIRNVSSRAGVLRGAALRSGSYRDRYTATPLTGAPATQDDAAHGGFRPRTFYPNRLVTPNYYGALDQDSGTPSTRLMITPTQYRDGGFADIERVYDRLDFETFYSAETGRHGDNVPALAAPPTMTQILGRCDGADGVDFSAHVVGHPSAGVQQVFVTYTGDPDAEGIGHWASLDLAQDQADSTLWTGRLPLGGQDCQRLHFMVQAVNGVGLVGVDDDYGTLYHPVFDEYHVEESHLSLNGWHPTSTYRQRAGVQVRLTAPPGRFDRPLAGRRITLTVGPMTADGRTNEQGLAEFGFPLELTPGVYPASVSYAGDSDQDHDANGQWIDHRPVRLDLTLEVQKMPMKVDLTKDDTSIRATLTNLGGLPFAQKSVYLAATDADGTVLAGTAVATDADGIGRWALTDLPAGTSKVTAYFGTTDAPTPGGGRLDLSDAVLSAADPVTVDVTG